MRRHRIRAGILAGILVAASVACGSGGTPSASSPVQLFLPQSGTANAVVVLVPGGGWSTADPTGLEPLARELAKAGYAAATITYRAASVGAHFPVPVEDVLCAAASAAADVSTGDGGRARVVLVGHSAGGQLAALAALRPEAFRSSCSDPAVTPAGVVALAGAFDLAGIADDLFGRSQQDRPDLWREGDVFSWVRERPQLPVLLVHGESDRLVPVSATRRLAAALAAAGHPVKTEVLPAATHSDIYTPDVVLGILLGWLSTNGFGVVPTGGGGVT